MKKQDNPKKNSFGPHITYITLDISYNDNKKVRIKKIHKDYETEELTKSKYKINDDETYIYDNQVDLDMFYIPIISQRTSLFDFFRRSNLKSDNEGFYNLKKELSKSRKINLKPDYEGFYTQKKELYKYGGNLVKFDGDFFKPKDGLFKRSIDIYVGMKNPDEQLNDNLCSILHQLCKKYLKTGIMFTSKEGIICRIDDCSYSKNAIKKFLEDFVIITEKMILREI